MPRATTQPDPYERQRRYERRKAAAVADVGEIPPVADPARREACRLDLERFLVTYFPNSTGLNPFSGDHVKVIGRIQRCILDGGLFAQAVYRGFAKTTISENAALWAVLYGHRRFVPIFGADASAAEGNIDSIKLELSENDLLYADFPEVCHPVRKLENKPQRCASQTHTPREACPACGGVAAVVAPACERCEGRGTVPGAPRLTRVEWRADTIVLPTVEGSVASGAIVTARGIMAGCRGMKHKRADGTQQRPDFVILDDPQTDESATSDVQVVKRLDTIRKSILKLGGHNRRIAVVMNATVIRPGDLVERLLDPSKFPAWQGERIRMVRKFADAHETLWLRDYAALRNTYDKDQLGDQQRAHRAATEFYLNNRAAMDAGCEVSWAHCYDRDVEVSAIQHAYNALIDDGPEVFASECQNEPLQPKEDAAGGLALSADEVANKLNGLPRGALPMEASRLVVFIDVMKDVLYWAAAGVADDFTGAVVDYDTFPEQKGRRYFASADVRVTLAKVTRGQSLEECLYAGLDALVTSLMGREWRRQDGAVLKPEKILVDANWGESEQVVKLFCRQSPHAAVLLPSHGRGIGATARPLNERKRQPGDRVGQHWYVPGSTGKRHVVVDVNHWKTFMVGRLRTGMGGRGCWTLFGDDAAEHQLFADHLAAELPVEVEARGRRVVEWKVRPHRPDNHYFDCLVGCGVAASVQGAALREVAAPARRAARVKLSELQKQRRASAAR